MVIFTLYLDVENVQKSLRKQDETKETKDEHMFHNTMIQNAKLSISISSAKTAFPRVMDVLLFHGHKLIPILQCLHNIGGQQYDTQ